MQATLVVSAGVVRDGRVLMVQEGKEGYHGMWGLPGGRMEPGERIDEAIVREMLEETGLAVRIIGLTRVVRYTSQKGYHTMRFNFLVEPTGGEIRVDGDEILEARWMTYDEIAAIPDELLRTPAIARAIIADIEAGRVYPVEVLLDAS